MRLFSLFYLANHMLGTLQHLTASLISSVPNQPSNKYFLSIMDDLQRKLAAVLVMLLGNLASVATLNAWF